MLEAEDYQIYVSYESETDDLASSLEFLSKAVSNHSKADKFLAKTIDENISTKVVLDNIKKSSIRLFLTNVIENTPEEKIHDKGIKAYWHQFLVDFRKPFLEYASNHKTLESKEDLKELKKQSIETVRKHKIDSVGVESMSDKNLAEYLANYSVPEGLSKNQSYKAKCGGKEYTIDKEFKVTSEQITNIIGGKEEILKNQTVYLKPKSVVYEGNGMWEFYVSRSSNKVNGKILDEKWLVDFQQGNLPNKEYPYPGKILKAEADIIVKFDESNFKSGEMYNITKVYGPAEPDEVPQELLNGF